MESDNNDSQSKKPLKQSEEKAGSSSATGQNVGEDEEADYVPDDGENSIDDETTLEEQEAMENEGDIADEVAALQEEQDIPVEELIRLYGYNTDTDTDPSKVSSAPGTSSAVSTDQQPSRIVDAASSAASSIPAGPGVTITRHYQSYFAVTTTGDNGSNADEDDEDDEYRGDGAGHEHGYFSTSDEDSENDFDYIPEESWRKEIKIGLDHQADVTDSVLSPLDNIDTPDDLDACVWSPNTVRVDEATVETYLKSAYQSQRAILCESKQSDSKESSADGTQGNDSAPASGLKRKIETPQHETGGQDQPKLICLRDDETALKLLYESQYDVESALVAWKRTVSERVQKEPAADDPDRPWTEEEQTLFEDGLKVHGKNFRLIQQEFLPNRKATDLVRYYYLWKRTERHDVFVQNFRFEKRQYAFHPTATDYMDHFLDHMAIVGATSTMAPAASAFEQSENQQHYHILPQSNHHGYLSLLPPNSASSRNHFFLAQSQKVSSEEVVVTGDLNNVNNSGGGEVDEVNNHSERDNAH